MRRGQALSCWGLRGSGLRDPKCPGITIDIFVDLIEKDIPTRFPVEIFNIKPAIVENFSVIGEALSL